MITIGMLNCNTGHAEGVELPTSTVHVQAFGPFGEKITAFQIHLYTPDRKRDLARPGQPSPIANVPYGAYTLLVYDTGGGVAAREIVINTKDAWVRVGLPFPGGDRVWPGGGLSISGSIRFKPNNKDWWVRVEGVFIHTAKECPLPHSGKFSIGGLEMGTYLVQVFEGGSIRHVEAIEIDPKREDTYLTIEIPEKKRALDASR
jgi:hypothetical protein